jgi:DNA-binding FrmR family transcriptional regulator
MLKYSKHSENLVYCEAKKMKNLDRNIKLHHQDPEDGPVEGLGHEGAHHGGGSHTHTHRNTKAVINRCSRAIGHLTAVRGMIQEGRDCPEVLIQLAAVRSAINGICEMILQDHIDHCIVDAVKTGDMEAVEELNKAIKLLVK